MTCHLTKEPKQVTNQKIDQENDLVVEPEEEVIDIDDSTADDYLHSVKKWLQTQEKDNSRDDYP